MDDFNNNRGLADIVADVRKELQEFVQTRLALFREELREKIRILKFAIPLVTAAAALLLTAYLLFTAALVSLVVVAFQGPYRWFFAFLIIGAIWVIFGGIAAFLAKRHFDLDQLRPHKTIEVLRGDKFWIQEETKRSDYEQRAS